MPPGESFAVYSVNKDGEIVVGKGHSSRITRRDAELVELTFDDGSSVKCTPDHRFLLRDGSYKEAQFLTIDDSLMAGYFDKAPINARTNDYLRVLQPKTAEWQFVHRLADDYNAARGDVAAIEGSWVRHHVNGDRFDNRPENIARMGWLEHLHLHAAQLKELWQQDGFRQKHRAGVKAYYAAHPEVVAQRQARMISQNKDAGFRRANGPRVARSLRARHLENPQLAIERGEQLRQLWQDADYRAKMSAALRGIEKRPLTPAQKQRVASIIAEKSRQMWNEPAKRAQIVQAIVRALSDAAVRARLSENSRALWQNEQYRAQFAPDHHAQMARKLWENPATRELHRKKIELQWQDPTFRAAHLKGREKDWARRQNENPNCMAELAARSAESLAKLWATDDYGSRVMRTKIAGYTAKLLAKHGQEPITPAFYDEQRDANWIPNSEKAIGYFGSFDELLNAAATHNHRVVRVRWLSEVADVYDITVDEHHNFMLANGCVVHNSVDGDAPAAYRYTEARMAPLASELLRDIDSDTVDFGPNFSETTTEPTVFPAVYPNLLVNGSAGIAVGMATNIPPHNLGEVCDAVAMLIDTPNASVDDLMTVIPGPRLSDCRFNSGKKGHSQRV